MREGRGKRKEGRGELLYNVVSEFLAGGIMTQETEKPMGRMAIVPGSFDPVTNGHLDIIERASKLFDEVIVAVARNAGKSPLFTESERVEMLIEITNSLPNVHVSSFDGLLVNYAGMMGATAIVRGLRAVSDFEYELQMAHMNRRQAPGIETVFMMTSDRYSYLSSSIVKEIARLGGSVEGLVPASVKQRLHARLGLEAPCE